MFLKNSFMENIDWFVISFIVKSKKKSPDCNKLF